MSGPYTSGAGVLEVPPASSSPGGSLPLGVATGDFLRFNATSGTWEVSSEPLALRGLILTPALASLIDAEGALYYNSTEKAVKVCTSV